MRKRGIIRSWYQNRHFGIIRVGATVNKEQYFVHESSFGVLPEGTVIQPGIVVEFETGKAKIEGDLPAALHVTIVPDDTPLPVNPAESATSEGGSR